MTAVTQRKIKPDEDGLRLDRWFARHFPQLTHGRLEKLLRTGQVRVDGARVKANHRVEGGQTVRVPPLPAPSPEQMEKKAPVVSAKDRAFMEGLVLYRDAEVIVLNKPAGLAVQGGTNTDRHVDGLLPALVDKGAERPRLVHRLDRDTSGVLVLAATVRAAASLALAFRGRDAQKLYWALTYGVPTPRRGKIDAALIKSVAEDGREKVRVAFQDEEEDVKSAVTLFDTIDHATTMSWLALMPLTGRTHQLRAHCAAIGVPIVGDGKYGTEPSRSHGEIPNKLMLHARSLRIRHPKGHTLSVTAPLPPHMAKIWDMLAFNKDDNSDPFKDELAPKRPREERQYKNAKEDRPRRDERPRRNAKQERPAKTKGKGRR